MVAYAVFYDKWGNTTEYIGYGWAFTVICFTLSAVAWLIATLDFVTGEKSAPPPSNKAESRVSEPNRSLHV